MKKSRQEHFLQIVETIQDNEYKKWLLENQSIFITRPKTQKKAYLDALNDESLKSGLEDVAIYKGEIWFANLNPNGAGKIRPVLIWQNNLLNRAVTLGIYHSIIVLPLSSRLYGGIYRYKIEKRNNLPKTSEVVCQAIGLISANKIMKEKGVLTKLTKEEMKDIKDILLQIFGNES